MIFNLEEYDENFIAEEVEELDDNMQELFDTAIESFENEYGTCDETSHETQPSEDGGTYSKEYFTNGVVSTETNLNFQVGGWFNMDLRNIEEGDNPSISCMLGFTINGKNVGDCEAFMGEYSIEDDSWMLEWDTY